MHALANVLEVDLYVFHEDGNIVPISSKLDGPIIEGGPHVTIAFVGNGHYQSIEVEDAKPTSGTILYYKNMTEKSYSTID